MKQNRSRRAMAVLSNDWHACGSGLCVSFYNGSGPMEATD